LLLYESPSACCNLPQAEKPNKSGGLSTH
jgi:hypothetical protein